METLLGEFESITKFSVVEAKKKHPRFDNIITELTLDFESMNKHTRLILCKPFPPLGRHNGRLKRLKSLCAEDIDHISVFDAVPDERCPKDARVEIWMNNDGGEITLSCEIVKTSPS